MLSGSGSSARLATLGAEGSRGHMAALAGDRPEAVTAADAPPSGEAGISDSRAPPAPFTREDAGTARSGTDGSGRGRVGSATLAGRPIRGGFEFCVAPGCESFRPVGDLKVPWRLCWRPGSPPEMAAIFTPD